MVVTHDHLSTSSDLQWQVLLSQSHTSLGMRLFHSQICLGMRLFHSQICLGMRLLHMLKGSSQLRIFFDVNCD